MGRLGLFVFGATIVIVIILGIFGPMTTSKANYNNAQATSVILDSSSGATAIIMKTSADSTKTVAESCQIQPYREGCLPAGMELKYKENPVQTTIPVFAGLGQCLGILVIILLIFGVFGLLLKMMG